MPDKNHKIHIGENAPSVCRNCAQRLLEIADAAIRDHGRFDLALAGGSTPRRLYELLTGPDYSGRIDRVNTHIWFGDERCVPPDHPDSNYRMAREAMLDDLGMPDANIHRYICETPESAAAQYEAALREIPTANGRPVFDLILLGLGPDGHTASLFPGTDALAERARNIVTLPATDKRTQRISFTYPLINAARNVFFLVTGAGKADIVAEILGEGGQSSKYPAGGIHPVGNLLWLLDQDAAAGLTD